MTRLPQKYRWLENEPGPKILLEALKLYGTKEIPGAKHNPTILGWARHIGGWIKSYYTNDEIPWCGLAMAYVAKQAGFEFNQKALSAKAWLDWGTPVEKPELGDVCVFKRPGGNHVGLYVGEDLNAYHILGGNQSNAFGFARLEKARAIGFRRCTWKISQPTNIRRVYLGADSKVSTNEA